MTFRLLSDISLVIAALNSLLTGVFDMKGGLEWSIFFLLLAIYCELRAQ